MIEDLLFIAKELLDSLHLVEFSEEERDFIINLVGKIIILIELEKKRIGP